MTEHIDSGRDPIGPTIEQPCQGCWRTTAILVERCAELLLNDDATLLKNHDVDHVANFLSTDQCGQLVDEDLQQGIECDAIDHDGRLTELWAVVTYDIDQQDLIASRRDALDGNANKGR
jgi:hypothetical protein